MKSINEFIDSNVIFGRIFNEAKETLPTVDMSFEEWLKELPKDKDGTDVVDVTGLPDKDKWGNKVITLASTSYVSAFKELDKRLEDKKNEVGVIVIPFNNFYLCMIHKYRKDSLDDISLSAVQPKTVSIKSVIASTHAMFKVYVDIYLQEKNDIKKIISEIVKAANRQETIDRSGTKASFIDNLNKEYGAEAQEAAAKSKEVTPDKSPFKLSKKKKFPDYIKHCLIKSTDNVVVKKYSYWGEAEIFVETVKKDGKNYYKVYMGDVRSTLDNGKDELYTFYLTTLGSLDKFLEYTLKPNRQKMHSELGDDGEVHVWHSSMQKNLPGALKKDCIKDEKLIKELGFHDMDIYKLYKD